MIDDDSDLLDDFMIMEMMEENDTDRYRKSSGGGSGCLPVLGCLPTTLMAIVFFLILRLILL